VTPPSAHQHAAVDVERRAGDPLEAGVPTIEEVVAGG